MRHQRISQEESYLCRCSTTFLLDQKIMKKNAWRMPNSFLCMQKDLEKDKGHSLVPVLKRSGIATVKTAHKEYGTIWLKGCCWNSQKVIVQFSALRAQCPEVDSEAKDMDNCRYTMQSICKRLKLFFAQLVLQIGSVFTEQSRRYVKSMKPFMKERGDPL